jgi:ABC-type transporter Mla subunit MlaD
VELDDAAQEALGKLKSFEEEADQWDDVHAELAQTLDDVSGKFDQGWDKVQEAGRSLLEELTSEKAELGQIHRETLLGIGGLKEEAHEQRTQTEEAYTKARAEVEAFDQELTELTPRLSQILEQVEQRGEKLKARANAIETEMEQLASAASDFLNNEISNAFRELAQQVDQRGDELEAFVTGEYLPQLENKVEELQGKLQDAQDQFKEKAENLGDTLENAASEALEKCLGEHAQVLNDLVQAGEGLKGIMEALAGAVDTGGTLVADGKDALDAGVNATSTGLNAGIGALRELTEFFSRFSFVKI